MNNNNKVIKNFEEGLSFDTSYETVKFDVTLLGEKSCSKCNSVFADFMKMITPECGIDFEENYCIWCTFLKETGIFELFLDSISGEWLNAKENLGRLLSVGREKTGMTIEALSDYCEVPAEYIQCIEEGKYFSRYNVKQYNNYWLTQASDGEITERILEHIVYKLNDMKRSV